MMTESKSSPPKAAVAKALSIAPSSSSSSPTPPAQSPRSRQAALAPWTGMAPPIKPRCGHELVDYSNMSRRMIWVGGGQIPETIRSTPRSMNCLRPTVFQDFAMARSLLQMGSLGLKLHNIDVALSSSNDSDAMSLAAWWLKIRYHMEEYGYDSVFRLFDIRTNSETYLLDSAQQTSNMTEETLLSWITQLTETGVPRYRPNGIDEQLAVARHPVCLFDVENLLQSGQALLQSVDIEIRVRVETELTASKVLGSFPPYGPIVVWKILNVYRQMTERRNRFF